MEPLNFKSGQKTEIDLLFHKNVLRSEMGFCEKCHVGRTTW